MSSEEIAGIDVEPVTNWLAEHVGTEGSLTFHRLPGGHSNLTYRVTDANGRTVVLRRPPMGQLLPTAHDMGREYRIIAALGPTAVPVPPALGYCESPDVTGAHFYVMGWVDGHVLHSASIAVDAFDEAARRRCGESFIEVLGELHAIEPESVGLGDLGRTSGYLQRQLKRWGSQYEASKTQERPAMDEVTRWLSEHAPADPPARVVHGDYRLGNCLAADDGPIAAVLDWEIATLGDPLADLGYVLATWPEPGETGPGAGGGIAPSTAPGFPDRAELTKRYAERTGFDVSGIDYYVAFAAWKSAAIAEGVYARYLQGSLSTEGVDLEGFPKGVSAFIEMAQRAIAGQP